MNFSIGKNGDVKVVLVDSKLDNDNELLKFLSEKKIFEGKKGQTYFNLNQNGESFLFAGIGEESQLTLEDLRRLFHSVGKKLIENKVNSIYVDIPKICDLDYFETIKAITEGLLQSESVFDKYKTEKEIIPTVENVYYNTIDESIAKKAIEEMEIIYSGITLTRKLVNERAGSMYPEILANEAKTNLEPLGIKVEVFDKDTIKKMGMEAFLAVSEGSEKEPKFIVMTYEGNPNSTEKIALVGKGLTFDSGGYSLKPANGMETMYTDMTGSATVIGALKSIAQAKLEKNVVGIIAACENLISGKAYKPGDIIGSMSGKTIEVLNTDAEGRLTLADALWYAADIVKADKIIDLATLTGACGVALGQITAGAITNDDKLMEDISNAANLSGEPVWKLPTNDDYRSFVKSKFADLTNTSSGGPGAGAGTIVAGLFLEQFVKDTPWVHLDIAGTAYSGSGTNYIPAGATGRHVKTLFNYIKNA